MLPTLLVLKKNTVFPQSQRPHKMEHCINMLKMSTSIYAHTYVLHYVGNLKASQVLLFIYGIAADCSECITTYNAIDHSNYLVLTYVQWARTHV